MYRFKVTIDKTKIASVDNSTVFTDVSGKGWAAFGAAKLSTTAYKFAPASGVFDGASGTYITTPDHADFAMGTGDYTVDFWFKTAQTTQGYIFYQGDGSATSSTVSFLISVVGNKLRFIPDYSSDPGYHLIESTGAVNDNIWHHAACVRNGDTFSLYIDGTFQNSATFSYTAVDSTYPVFIGQLSTSLLPFAGNLSEFRVSKGIARWTSAFTPPVLKYTIDSYTKVLLHFGDDLVNFPYLFSESCSNLPAGFWAHVSDVTSGLDIRFFDTDGTTELKREVVVYSSGTQKVEAWVQIPSLGTAINKEIWCQYGGSTTANSTAVWADISTQEAWHFQNSYNGALNLVNGTNYSTTDGAGKIEQGIALVGASSQYVDMGSNIGFQASDSFSFSAWVKLSSGDSSDYRSIIRRGGTNSSAVYRLGTQITTGYPRFELWSNSGPGGGSAVINGSTNICDDAWHYIVGVRNKTDGKVYVYLDGIDNQSGGVADTTTGDFTSFDSGGGLCVGRSPYNNEYVTGSVDEIRVIKSALSSSWIATEYANQNAPATFSSCGTEESLTSYRFRITIDRTKVTGSNTNFVYLFSEGCNSIPAGFWSHVSDAVSGLDIKFFDTDGVTELKREVVLYSYATQKVEAWVQLPSLGTSVNKEIWCQYGGSTTANSTAVWTDINASGVWHFQDTIVNSTGSTNATVSGATQVTTGKFNKAYRFANTQYLSVAKTMHSGTYTVSAWAYPVSDMVDGYGLIASDGRSSLFFGATQSDVYGIYGGNTGWGNASYYGGWIGTGSGDTLASQKNAWHRVTTTYDGTTLRIYVDGVLKNSRVQGIAGCGPTTTIGGDTTSYTLTDGSIDDLQFYTDAKSGDWIATEYANQNAPSTFYTCSPEEELPSAYKFPITIDKTKVSGTHTNFVYLFTESVIGIPGGFWSRVRDTNGLDIRFYDSNGMVELKREIVLFDSVTKKVEAWVQVPTLSSSNDKTIWCAYGGSTLVNSTAVWTDINARGVYHYQNLANDSAGTAHMTVNGATQIDGGRIQKAYSFTGTNNMTVTKAMNAGPYTISAWVYVTGAAPSSYRVITSDSDGYTFWLALTDTDPLNIYGGSGWGIARYDGTWTGTSSGDSYASQKDVWRYITATYDNDKYRIYVDGVLRNTSVSIGTQSAGTGTQVGMFLDGYRMAGIIDELAYFTSVRSNEWIATEYANQNDPATFSRCGVESNSGETATVLMIL
jgi:hypothetical protein